LKKIYAGIGSRKTPSVILKRMELIGGALNSLGFVLRSGAADGADAAFEKGAKKKKEIYLPWKGFNNHDSDLFNVSGEALKIGEKYHPGWASLTSSVRKLIARNGYQVLGEKLDNPADFIICYTQGGKEVGGTSQAIRIAKDYDIPVFNIWNNRSYVYFMMYLLKLLTKKNLFYL